MYRRKKTFWGNPGTKFKLSYSTVLYCDRIACLTNKRDGWPAQSHKKQKIFSPSDFGLFRTTVQGTHQLALLLARRATDIVDRSDAHSQIVQ